MFKSIVAKLKIPKLNYKFSLILEKNEDWLFLLIGLALALALRLLLRGYVSGDAVTGSLPWYDYIESHQVIEALKHNFSGYPPLYLIYAGCQLLHQSILKSQSPGSHKEHLNCV